MSDLDIIEITKRNRFLKKCIIVNTIMFIFLSSSLIFTGFTTRKIYIYKNFKKTLSLKRQNSSIIYKLIKISYFLKDKERLIIDGKDGDTKDNAFNILNDCFITTPHLRKKIYRGKTNTILIDNTKNSFSVPEPMFLTNKDKGKNNYISTLELNGIFSKKISSEKKFSINDDNIFLSGNNFLFLHDKNYLKISKKPHLKYIKNDADKKKEKVYDIKSNKMEVFFDKKYSTFNKNVVFNDRDTIIKSQFAKVYFNDEQQPTDIFISDNINATNGKNSATSEFGYFDIEKNMLILYKNVYLYSKNNSSDGEFYIYNTNNKTTISFNENTIFYQKDEQKNVYKILKKIAQEVDEVDKQFILDVIENNKKNNAKQLIIKNSENYNIDRTKRTRTNIF